jgi:DNA-binding CsgD family transcriptional regulator/tetratricopeptide (TPR) repeat protein
LAEAERTLVDLIAVANTCATLPVLKAAGGQVEGGLHTLLRHGHIKEHLNGHELIYRVAHPLYAEVAYAELTEIERRKLHARLATTIDTFAPDNVLSLAPHYRDAGDYVDPQRAIDVLAMAGERALNVYAAPEAVDYLSRALSRARDDRREHVPSLLDALGAAYQGAGMLGEATETWSERLTIAETQADTERQATLLTQLAMLESERGYPDLADRHLKALLHLKGDRDIEASALRITIACRQWPRARAYALHRQVIEAYRDDHRPSAQAMHYNAAGHLASMEGRFDDALRLLSQSEQLANEGVLPFQPQRILAGVRLLTGDIPGALTTITEEAAANASFVFPSAAYTMRMVHASGSYFAGDLLGALAALDKDIAASTQTGMHRMTVRILAFRAFLLAELGRLEEARQSLAEAEPGRPVLQDSWGIARTSIALHSGHPGQAPPLDTAEFVFRDPIINGLRILGAGQAALAANDHKKACEILEFLRFTGRRAALLDALADRQEGVLTRQPDLLRQAASRLQAMGAPVLAAQADLAAAELDPGHDTIISCLSRFHEAGLTPWLDRTKRLARKHNIVTPIDKVTGLLSKRESEVVHLLADGLSNADIASRLFLSERTVESHLSSSYRKLNITSRLRLAQWAQGNT